jgi:hypothetical protein
MRKITLLSFVIIAFIAVWTNVLTVQASSNSVSGDVWEVEIVKKSTNEVVVSQVVATNAFPLDGLEGNTEYFARVRTKSFVYSGWITSSVFTYNRTTGMIQSNFTQEFVARSEKGRLIISSTVPQHINIYSINGCLIRSVDIENGEVVVAGLEKGVYLANNRKIIVE